MNPQELEQLRELLIEIVQDRDEESLNNLWKLKLLPEANNSPEEKMFFGQIYELLQDKNPDDLKWFISKLEPVSETNANKETNLTDEKLSGSKEEQKQILQQVFLTGIALKAINPNQFTEKVDEAARAMREYHLEIRNLIDNLLLSGYPTFQCLVIIRAATIKAGVNESDL